MARINSSKTPLPPKFFGDGLTFDDVLLLPAYSDVLPRETDIVVVCHHGMRSLQVANYLAQAGFKRVFNLSGGIAAWAQQVDTAMPSY